MKTFGSWCLNAIYVIMSVNKTQGVDMGGGGNLLPGGGDPLKGLESVLKPGKDSIGFTLDPGGLFYTSKDQDVAALQSRLDPMAIGAKATVSTREAEKRYGEEVAAATKAAEEERRRVEAQSGIEAERQRRLDARRKARIERGSLMYGMETGGGDTLG